MPEQSTTEQHAFEPVRPVDNCGHVGPDGLCQHPDNMTPECHADACPLVPIAPRFTRGEWVKWRLAPDSDPRERLIITTADGETEICGVVENEADADLIAAAPALLKACQAMQKSLNGSATDFAGMLAAHRQLDAAVALALNSKK